MTWQVPRIWEGGDVWILGGGPSVTKQFGIPDKVVQDVVKGLSPPSVYSPYMVPIHDKHIIGINVAYLIGDWIDMVFVGDQAFFFKHIDGLAKFPGMKVTCHHMTEGYDWVKYLVRDSRHGRGISDNPKMVSWNGNSGAAAISVAANAGAKRIILLGFDMKLDETKKQWWHNLYGRDPNAKRSPKKPWHMPFDRHLRGFPEIQKDARRRGIEIWNVSPDSAIREFPKMNLSEALERSKKLVVEEV